MRKIIDLKPREDPAFLELLAHIGESRREISLAGLQGAARALVLARLRPHLDGALLVLTPTDQEALSFRQDLAFFLGDGSVVHFPPWDIRSIDPISPQRTLERTRLAVLGRLLEEEAVVVVASLAAALQRTLPKEMLLSWRQTLSMGDFIDRDGLAVKLLEGGYEAVSLVEEPGQFSIRGHVVDVFPPVREQPYRLELFGDEIEGIREFDPVSQRSLREVVSFPIVPAREILVTGQGRKRAERNVRQRALALDLPRSTRDRLLEAVSGGAVHSLHPLYLPLFYAAPEDPADGPPPGSLLEFLPPAAPVVLDDPPAIDRAQEDLENAVDRTLGKARQEERFFLERSAFLLSPEECRQRIGARRRIRLESLLLGAGEGSPAAAVSFSTAPSPVMHRVAPVSRDNEGRFGELAGRIRDDLAAGEQVLLLASGPEERERMASFLQAARLPFRIPGERLPEEMDRPRAGGDLLLAEGRISAGFSWKARRLVVLTDEDLFGKKIPRRPRRLPREGFFLKSFGDLAEGDLVVHKEFGIGRYQGLRRLAFSGIENDFLLVEYAEGDKLYLPVDRLDQLQRYIGPDGESPRIDRLGGTSWESTKERVQKSIRDMAEELVAVYAAREILERKTFSPPRGLDEEFAASFEYEETPDQARAIEDIHADMSLAKPMDRLVCGDAGFGKTEVALRASFRCVMDGRQVAVLTPTTILAEQHYKTFLRRFEPYPVRIETLNRMKTKAEQQKIAEDLRRGAVDIVIGTHRLLQKDVAFRDLGLVIIDEEQRFGVVHKERLKKLRTLVDVLTLTATPIPRTLHLSLVGIRDLSVIHTPPEDRVPVKTYVLEFDEEVIRDAIRQELQRGGQVFFLHDRVRSIHNVAGLVEQLVPEARISVIHGRMKPREIEDVMVRFLRQETDVLVCTTIIGSGVDIPTANTILVNRADRFGLAQLYQIRGRVGRAREESYAYLMVPRGAMLSRDAVKRLQVILDFSEPGSGFKIATSDLEIRGTGNLLGSSQSGHVSAVGYEMYTELMERAIRELKGQEMPEEDIRPEISLGIAAYLPAEYIGDEHQRLVSYKRISMAASDEELREIREGLEDCYGPLPKEASSLFEAIRIRNRLKELKIRRFAYDGRQASLTLTAATPVDPKRILSLSRGPYRGITLAPDGRLSVPLPDRRGAGVIEGAHEILRALTV
ncbi:MAG: transcription-repair coupling factor [Syntrophaceae bacterium]|nr:transcription-repair coupling factor [Syntrophaceae bacterium]